jgi:hypothetical protein
MSIFVSDDILGFGAMHSRQSAKVRELEADLESRANAIGRQQVPLSFDPMKARDLDTIQTRGIDDTRKSPQGKPIGANRLLEPTFSDKQKERFAATGLVVQADQTCVISRILFLCLPASNYSYKFSYSLHGNFRTYEN